MHIDRVFNEDIRLIESVGGSALRAFKNMSHAGILHRLSIKSTLVGEIRGPDGKVKKHWTDRNLTTDAGDLYYAKLLAVEAGGQTFNTLVFGTAGTPAKGSDFSGLTEVDSPNSRKVFTVRETNNLDTPNTGKGLDVTTYKFVYTAGDFTGSSIIKIVITNPTPGASEPLLMFATITTFDLAAADSLTFWVNHEMVGAV